MPWRFKKICSAGGMCTTSGCFLRNTHLKLWVKRQLAIKEDRKSDDSVKKATFYYLIERHIPAGVQYKHLDKRLGLVRRKRLVHYYFQNLTLRVNDLGEYERRQCQDHGETRLKFNENNKKCVRLDLKVFNKIN
ncbi:hypothetical protein RhiirB3_385285 [Rhizophagus irregularis]|nr:hypothetical protein RhiirB3_385285 [Rhizophagus irregularis]